MPLRAFVRHGLRGANRSARHRVLLTESSPAGRCGAAPSLEDTIVTVTPDQPAETARPRRRAGIGRLLLAGAAGVLLTLAVMTVLWWPRTEVTYRSTAPASVVYADDSPHYLELVHRHTLSGEHRYHLVIGRYTGAAYGHWLDVDTAVAVEGIESTTWTESDVRVRFSTGHEVVVPARFFLFGR
ncbi:hypothetical protein AB0D99_16700 [Streptomyces sp. NPDC047971]|uniref:hypothetical protein n=1 Tax=Streptomyces sp. NPDC047971 TaxID=3154499 RepID=UPI0033C55017